MILFDILVAMSPFLLWNVQKKFVLAFLTFTDCQITLKSTQIYWKNMKDLRIFDVLGFFSLQRGNELSIKI